MQTETRRSPRLSLSIPVELSYVDSQGQPRLERTHTLSVDRHGGRLATQCFHPTGGVIHLGIPHLGRSAHCRVVWCSAPVHDTYEIGVEMIHEANIWGMQFPNDRPSVSNHMDTAVLVQMLEERGIFVKGEFQARVS